MKYSEAILWSRLTYKQIAATVGCSLGGTQHTILTRTLPSQRRKQRSQTQ